MYINVKEFLNTPDEVHALAIGLAEVVCPWPPLHRTLTWQYADTLRREYHYYVLGRALGIFAWLGIAALTKKILL